MSKKRKSNSQIINKQNNSFGGGLANMLLFSGTPSIENLINSQDYGKDTAYSVSYALTNKNVVVSRFVQFIADAMTEATIVDKNGDEVLSWFWPIVLEEVKTIFGDEGELTERIYNTIRNFVACGMSINAPSIVSDTGHAIKIIPLDNRKVRLTQNKEGIFELEYKSKKMQFYSKTLKKPSLNREWYGDCLFSGAIDDALVDRYTKMTAQKKYENNANPDIVYMIEQGKVLSEEQKKKIERSFKERFWGAENQGKPLVSDLIRDVKVIDSMDAVIKSIDIRLHSNKNIGMMLGVDLRGLGWLREWGSQAELNAVRIAVNGEFAKRADLLGKTLTRAYEKLVAPLNGANIKILPKYLKDNQALIKIALEALDKWVIEKEYVQNLLYNEIW
mgnify:CR=1 FL=1